jgi:hypothetical protein
MNPITEQFLQNIQKFANSVASEKYDLESPIPSRADRVLQTTWPLLDELSDADVNDIREVIDIDLAGKLLAYSRRAAVMGLREGADEAVRFGLYAVSLDADLLDIRDVFRAVVLHFDVCRRHCLDFTMLFEMGLRFSTERRRNQLAGQFLSGPNYTKSLKTMKYTVVDTDYGPTYVDGLFSWP